jgi:very-short-patch-repair endonuclease
VIRAHPVDVLLRVGGTADAADLVALCGRPALRRAVADGTVVRLARGRYAMPLTPDPRRAAARLRGVVSHTSAAQHWDLAVLRAPDRPHVTIDPRRGRVTAGAAVLHWSRLADCEVHDGVTSPLRTVLDCARTLEEAPALAIADSALRQQLVGRDELLTAAAAVRGAGRRRAIWVAENADPRAESPLESALRAIVLVHRLFGFEPQVVVADDGFFARVDLAHRRLRVVLEADSFEHHGTRGALVRDCRRYDELTVRGWRVLRFAWEHVMFEPQWVAATVGALVRPARCA